MKWAIIGFCGSLIISNVFYLLSPQPSFTIVYSSVALLIGLLLCSWILGNIVRENKDSQKNHMSRCKDTIIAIERRIRAEQAEMITTVNLEDYLDHSKIKEKERDAIVKSLDIKKGVTDILSELSQSARKG